MGVFNQNELDDFIFEFHQNELDDFIFERLIELGYAPTEEEVFNISDIFIEFLKENNAIILESDDGQQPND